MNQEFTKVKDFVESNFRERPVLTVAAALGAGYILTKPAVFRLVSNLALAIMSWQLQKNSEHEESPSSSAQTIPVDKPKLELDISNHH